MSAGWWLLAVALWPVDSRPYIGGSTNNSPLELAFGYNGLGRIFGGEGNGGGAPGREMAVASRRRRGAAVGCRGGAGGGGMGGFGGQAGLTRLFNTEIGGQISWLLPAALILLVAGLWFTRRAPRTDRIRAALLLWGGWTLVTALVFSLMEGTFHAYYTVALAPGIAALVADRRPRGVAGPRDLDRPRRPRRDHRDHRRLGLGAARPLDDVPALAALGRARGRRRRRDRAAGPGRMAGAGGHGRRRSGADRRAGGPDGVRGADRRDPAPGQHPDGGPEHRGRFRPGRADARARRRRRRTSETAPPPRTRRASRTAPRVSRADPAGSAWAAPVASRSTRSSRTC